MKNSNRLTFDFSIGYGPIDDFAIGPSNFVVKLRINKNAWRLRIDRVGIVLTKAVWDNPSDPVTLWCHDWRRDRRG